MALEYLGRWCSGGNLIHRHERLSLGPQKEPMSESDMAAHLCSNPSIPLERWDAGTGKSPEDPVSNQVGCEDQSVRLSSDLHTHVMACSFVQAHALSTLHAYHGTFIRARSHTLTFTCISQHTHSGRHMHSDFYMHMTAHSFMHVHTLWPLHAYHGTLICACAHTLNFTGMSQQAHSCTRTHGTQWWNH